MKDPKFERTFRNSLAEAKVVGVVWLAALLWTLWHYYFMSRYDPRHDAVFGGPRLVYGMPEAVYQGVIYPWVAVSLFTFWYALFRMKDDDLDAGSQA